ncbi:MAG: hypothetical protein HC769_24700 [Cyanobacteria bacterium CRU_2_1]|nr:hypothetical protein [Cyanobacteria bacterium CRU_2_1]
MARSGLVTPLDHSITQLNGQPEPSCCHECLEFTTFFSIPLDFQDNRYWLASTDRIFSVRCFNP